MSGTLNYIAKFTPNGTSVGNSIAFDNGTEIGIGTTTPSSLLTVYGGGALSIDAASHGFMAFRNAGAYYGYAGNWSGGTTDLDFGTGAGNTTGTVRLTIGASPAVIVTSQKTVGIGTLTPNAQLQVLSTRLYGAYISTDTLYELAHAIDGEYTGTGAYDGVGVYGYSHPLDFWGYGGIFSSTWIGSSSQAIANGASDYYGVVASAGYDGNTDPGGASLYGISASSSATTSTNYGGYFSSSGGIGTAIYGQSTGSAGSIISQYNSGGGVSSNENASILGIMSNAANTLEPYAIAAVNTDYSADYPMGLFAGAEASTGNTFANNAYGIYTESYGAATNYNIGILSDESYGTGPNLYAGYFVGDVYVSGTLSKAGGTFKIDHPQDPENKFLIHSFVESPDMMNIYNGNATTDASGEAIVTMPSYFEAENKDFRYQLTTIGQPAQVWVAEKISGNQFKVKSDKPNVEISWQVTGVRQDAWANANRVVAEVEKKGVEKGKYLHPELFGKSKEFGMPATSARGEMHPNPSYKSSAQLAQEKVKADLAQKQAAVAKAAKTTK